MRVLLVDDHESYRQRLRELLDAESDVRVVAEAADGRTAVRLVGELELDVVVMDVALPELSGIKATRLITESFPAVKVLALSMHRQRSFVEGMLGAGASGYVLKDNASSQLSAALRTVAAGGTYVCTEPG